MIDLFEMLLDTGSQFTGLGFILLFAVYGFLGVLFFLIPLYVFKIHRELKRTQAILLDIKESLRADPKKDLHHPREPMSGSE